MVFCLITVLLINYYHSTMVWEIHMKNLFGSKLLCLGVKNILRPWMNISFYFPNLFKNIYGFIDGKTVECWLQ